MLLVQQQQHLYQIVPESGNPTDINYKILYEAVIAKNSCAEVFSSKTIQKTIVICRMSSQELRKTFTPSYFSVEDILASQTRVPCETAVAISKFGFLDPSQESADLPVGSLVELPLWAARVMCKQKRQYVAIKMPKYFNDSFREVLKADPAVVDLHKMGPHYYQAGLQICTLPNEESEQISEILPEALQRRVAAMFDTYSLNMDVKCTEEKTNDSGSVLRYNYMDPLEAQLYDDSKVASDKLDKWMRR